MNHILEALKKVRIVNPETKKKLMKIPGAYDHLYPGAYYTSNKIPEGEVLTLESEEEMREWGFVK